MGYISPGKASNSSEKKKFANATVKDVICETYKQVTTYRQCDGGCVYWSETIFFQYCYIGDGLSDQGPTGCGGNGNKDLMQSVDGSVCSDEDPVDDYPLDIINKVTDPCLRPLVASLINNNVSGKISEIISKLNGDAKVTVTFTDVELTSNNKPAMIGPISVSNGIYPITLSRLHLKETTRENVTAVIIHEVIHAFLNYSGQGNAIDGIEHETIALNYVNPMANYLIQLHGISERDAIGLAWSGLSDSNSYINNDIFNYSQGNLTKAEIQDTYRNFISGKSGILVCE